MRLTLHNSIRTWVFVTPVSTLIPPVPTLEHLQMLCCPAPAVAMAFWRSSAHTVPKTPESSAPLKRNISALRTQMVHMHLTEIISTTTRCKPSCLWRDGSSATSWCGLHPIFFLQRILPDADFFTEAVQNVEAFYRSAILSELLAKTHTCPDRLLSDKTQSTDSQELE